MLSRMIFLTALIGSAGVYEPCFSETNQELATKMAKVMELRPGSFVGNVPGAYLTEDMKSTSDAGLFSIPVLDVDFLCSGLQGCVQSEQDAYDEIKHSWSDFSLATRDVCLAFADKNSQGKYNQGTFYKRVLGCLSIREKVADQIEQYGRSHFRP